VDQLKVLAELIAAAGEAKAKSAPSRRPAEMHRRARLCANTAIASPKARGRFGRTVAGHDHHRRPAYPAPSPFASAVEVVVIMAKPRPTLPIAHADDLPRIAFTDEEWQAIERAYPRQLNADVRQQITTVTTQYLKDCVFERTAAPKAMACERIERIHRAAGDLAKVLDSKPFSASTDELSRGQQEQQQSVLSYTDHLIRRHFNDPRLAAGWRGDHFQGVLRSLVIACDCALNDLVVTAEGSGDGQAWDWWIQALTQIVQGHDLPYGARIVETSEEPSPFVALVCALQLTRALQEHVPPRHMFSDEALAKAIQRAQARARDK
jgi:hypothetical protein